MVFVGVCRDQDSNVNEDHIGEAGSMQLHPGMEGARPDVSHGLVSGRNENPQDRRMEQDEGDRSQAQERLSKAIYRGIQSL